MDMYEQVEAVIKSSYPVNTFTIIAVGIAGKGRAESYYFAEPAALSGTCICDDTLFEIGSITKLFTSALLVDMARDRLVDIHDTIDKFLPGSLHLKYGRHITLLQLATHTSGLPRLPDNLEASIIDSLNPYANYDAEL